MDTLLELGNAGDWKLTLDDDGLRLYFRKYADSQYTGGSSFTLEQLAGLKRCLEQVERVTKNI